MGTGLVAKALYGASWYNREPETTARSMAVVRRVMLTPRGRVGKKPEANRSTKRK